MKYIITAILIILSFKGYCNTVFVSTKGNDNNIGTIKKPLRTIEKALMKLSNDIDTIYVLEGIYKVERSIEVRGIKRKKGVNVLISSWSNPATITFSKQARGTKLLFYDCTNIVISKLNFVGSGTHFADTYDILLAIRNSNNVGVFDCNFSDAYEEGLKVSKSSEVLCVNNTFDNFNHEGVDFLNVDNGLICGNKIYNVGRVGIMVKGGSENILVANNYIFNNKKRMNTAAITVGGMTISTSAKSFKKGAFEAYNVYAINNIINSDITGGIQRGIAFFGAKSSLAFNNDIANAKIGIELARNKSRAYGWEDDVNNEDIVLDENVVDLTVSHDIKVTNTPKKNFYKDVTSSVKTDILGRSLLIFGKWHTISELLNNCSVL